MRFCPRRMAIVFVLLVLALYDLAGAQRPAIRATHDTLRLQHVPANGRLRLNFGELRAIQIGAPFRYVGGSRFILRETADAEQHLFIIADANKTIQRLFWVQIERLLPARSGAYNYGADSAIILHGFKLFANATTYTTAPEPLSDRARAFASLASAGYRVPDGARRLRLIFLPEQPARREVMIIYLETATETNAGGDSLVARAQRSIVLERRP
jgi:hypothetical protein